MSYQSLQFTSLGRNPEIHKQDIYDRELGTCYIDAICINAILPHENTEHATILVLDAGVKVAVKGDASEIAQIVDSVHQSRDGVTDYSGQVVWNVV